MLPTAGSETRQFGKQLEWSSEVCEMETGEKRRGQRRTGSTNDHCFRSRMRQGVIHATWHADVRVKNSAFIAHD